jgi:hypothetical protein
MGEHRRNLRVSAPGLWCRDGWAAAVHQTGGCMKWRRRRGHTFARLSGAHDVVRGGRSDIAHVVIAHLVFLRIIFYLWWGQPRAASMHDCGLYLGMVGVAGAIAVDR